VDPGSGQPKKIPPAGSAPSLRVCRSVGRECVVFLGETLTAPAEVWSCDVSGKTTPLRLTASNASLLANARMSTPQTLWGKGPTGVRVHAWLFPPVERKEGERAPLVVLLHGGPQGSWDDRFSYRWNPQVYAGAGYAVLMPDPRGSVGYGQAFTDDING